MRQAQTTAFALAMSLLGLARLDAQQHPITWTLATETKNAQQGKQFTASVFAQIPQGWHLYSTTQPPGGPIQTVLTLTGENNFALSGSIRVRDPDMAPDPNFQIVTETYSDSVTFVLPIVARVAGKQTFHVKVHYQTCTDRYCLPPMNEELELRLQIAPGIAPATIPRGT